MLIKIKMEIKSVKTQMREVVYSISHVFKGSHVRWRKSKIIIRHGLDD